MVTPYLYFDDIIASATKGGYSEKPKLSQNSSVFLLSLCVVAKMQWLWQNPIAPIDSTEWENIQELIRQAEADIMSTFGIGSILVSVADLDSEYSLLRLDGQTVAQADYPELALVCPASWLSGSDIVLADMSNKSIHGGYADVGNLIGANNYRLSIAEMPTHTHVQDSHQHTYNAPIVTPTAGGEIPTTADLVVPTPTSTSATVATNQDAGGGETFSNIPRSVKVFYYLVAR